MTRLAVPLLAAALLAVAPATASAATVAVDEDGTLLYRAADGARSALLVDEVAPRSVRLTRLEDEDSDPFVPGDGCSRDEATPEDDVVCTGVDRVDARLGDGVDRFFEGFQVRPFTVPTTVAAGPDGDVVTTGTASDVVLGEDGDDILDGGAGEDLVDGGAGNDLRVGGGDGDDEVLGGDGNDDLDGDDLNAAGDDGADRLDGGPGSDLLEGNGGADVLAGGTGFDTVSYYTESFVEEDPTPVTVTLDGQANDGRPGEGDEVRPDVEDVDGGEGDDALTGDAGPNVVTARRGDDVIDGADGEDQIDAAAGDDVIRARDGFLDRIICGPGADRVELDALDRVEGDCETVDRVDVGSRRDVPEDRPPTVAFTAPAPDASLGTGATTLAATAADDAGVVRVEFLDDGRVVASDDTAPYTATYRPTTDDVGRSTLAARAIDTSGQTAVDLRPVQVDRFAAPPLQAAVNPQRDRRRPFRFVTTGTLGRSPGVPLAQTCRGRVSVQIKAGRRTLSRRSARVRRDCSFVSAVRFRTRKRFAGRSRLRFVVRFAGNPVLAPGPPLVRTVRVRSG